MSATRQDAVSYLILIASNDNSNYTLRQNALTALGHAGGPEARAFLMSVIESGDYGHSMTVLAISALGYAAAEE